MPSKSSCSRRTFLTLASAAGVAVATHRQPHTLAAEQKIGGNDNSRAAQKLRWLADKFVQWQTAYGRIGRDRVPAVKDYPQALFAMELYKVFEATGNAVYKAAADRYFTYYLTRMCDAHDTPARHGIALAAWGDFKQYNPQETDFDRRMDCMFQYLMSYRWNEGSCFRNGYKGDEETYFRDGKKEVGMDAANTCDLAVMGDGLLSYYRFTKNQQALDTAYALAKYCVTECEPFTYKGCWSSKIGTWVVAPTGNTRWEHHTNTPVKDCGWGTGSQPTTDYLLQVYSLSKNEDLKRNIRQKCVTSMKWQFDACQFEDGALGMCGRDDKWLGMTAAGIQTFLWNRTAGFLTQAEIDRYRPKALAAFNWMFDHLDDDCLAKAGYYRVTGQSHPEPICHGYWGITWAFEPLIRFREI